MNCAMMSLGKGGFGESPNVGKSPGLGGET